MNSLKPLLKIQLLSWFGINKAIHSKDKREKKKFIGFIILVLFVVISMFITSFAYSYLMAISFEQLGIMYILLAVMMMATCLFTLVTTIYKTTGFLFAFKDYDTIMSLPIKTSTIVVSRLFTIYIMNILFSLIVMLPAGIIYAVKTIPSFEFYIIFIITFLFIPMIPIIIGTIIGSLIAVISSKFKKNNIINLILTILFFIGIMALSFTLQFSMQSGTDFANIGIQMINMINKIYPITIIYIDAVCNYNILSLILFVGVSVILFISFSTFVGYKYKSINTALTTVRTVSNYKLTTIKESSPFMALYKKELRRYFASPLYVLNTSTGLLLCVIMSLGLLIFGSESLEQLLELPGFSDIIGSLSPMVVSTFIAMSCTTCCSISLEGKSLWIIKSIPIKTKDILLSKIAVNLTILLPIILISGIILSLILNVSPIQIFMLFITPTVYAIFISLLGILVNLLYPNFSWESESVVVKRSVAMFISELLGMAVTILPIILLFIININLNIAIGVITMIFIVIDILLYKIVITKGVDIFSKL